MTQGVFMRGKGALTVLSCMQRLLERGWVASWLVGKLPLPWRLRAEWVGGQSHSAGAGSQTRPQNLQHTSVGKPTFARKLSPFYTLWHQQSWMEWKDGKDWIQNVHFEGRGRAQKTIRARRSLWTARAAAQESQFAGGVISRPAGRPGLRPKARPATASIYDTRPDRWKFECQWFCKNIQINWYQSKSFEQCSHNSSFFCYWNLKHKSWIRLRPLFYKYIYCKCIYWLTCTFGLTKHSRRYKTPN